MSYNHVIMTRVNLVLFLLLPSTAALGQAPGPPAGPSVGPSVVSAEEARMREMMRDPEKRAAMMRKFFPDPVYDKVAPDFPAGLKSGGILIFSKTNGFRDSPAIEASNAALAALAQRRGWPSFQTENAAVMEPRATPPI